MSRKGYTSVPMLYLSPDGSHDGARKRYRYTTQRTHDVRERKLVVLHKTTLEYVVWPVYKAFGSYITGLAELPH